MSIMRLLAVLLYFTLRSDIARQYPPGSEPSKGGQTGGLPYASGKELSHQGNGNLGRDNHDDRTR